MKPTTNARLGCFMTGLPIRNDLESHPPVLKMSSGFADIYQLLGYFKVMPRLFQTKYWQVQLPDGWAAHQTHLPDGWEAQTDTDLIEMVMFYSPSGVGMLQCVTWNKMYDGVGVGQPFRGKLTGKYYAGRTHNGTYRRSWHLSCMGRTLWISYSCAEKNAELEVLQVDEILQNIEENPQPNKRF
jgi:hypothetical protein